jgi:hypothetical protein
MNMETRDTATNAIIWRNDTLPPTHEYGKERHCHQYMKVEKGNTAINT